MITAAQVDAEEELASLCGVLNASYARLVAIVAAALVDQSWAIAGVRSPEHWLTMRAGLSPFRAKAIVAVARRHGELPTVMSAFADGQLSIDQVMVVARFAPAHVEASVAELAFYASVPQLRRALTHFSFDPPAEPGQTQQVTTFATGAGDTASGDNPTAGTDPVDPPAGGAEAEDTRAGAAEADESGFGGTRTSTTRITTRSTAWVSGFTSCATTDGELPRTHRRDPQPAMGRLRRTPRTRVRLTPPTSRPGRDPRTATSHGTRHTMQGAYSKCAHMGFRAASAWEDPSAKT
jgi:hypothetical protein